MDKEVLISVFKIIDDLSENEIKELSLTIRQGDALNKGKINIGVEYCKHVDLSPEGVKD